MERENETLKQAGEVVGKYVDEKAKLAVDIAQKVISGEIKPETPEELKLILSEANSWIGWICGEEADLYNLYCFRLFEADENKFYVARGEEVKEIHPRYGKRKNT
jgi:hypothetical protein